MLVEHLADRALAFGPRVRSLPALITRDVRIGAVGHKGGQVRHGEAAQQDPLACHGRESAIWHHVLRRSREAAVVTGAWPEEARTGPRERRANRSEAWWRPGIP